MLVSLLLVCGSVLPVFGQGSISELDELLPFSELKLTIELPANVSRLEPIPVVITLRNTNNRPALGYRNVAFQSSPVSMYVRKVGSSSRMPISPLLPINKFIGYRNTQMDAGSVVRSHNALSIDLDRFFPEAGNYELQASMSDAKGLQTIHSEPLVISVAEPTGNNRLAYNLIRSNQRNEYLFSEPDIQNSIGTLQTLANNFPSTPYGRHAAFVLGERSFLLRNYSEALTYLVRIEGDSSFIFEDKVRKYLAAIRGTPGVVQ